MVFSIVATWLAYRKAKDTGRDAIKLAFLAVAVFVATQLIVGLGIGVIVVLEAALFGCLRK